MISKAAEGVPAYGLGIVGNFRNRNSRERSGSWRRVDGLNLCIRKFLRQMSSGPDNRRVGRRATDDFGIIHRENAAHARLFQPVSGKHLQGIPAPHWQPSSSLHTRLGWFSQTQPRPEQMGHFALAVVESKHHQVRPVPFERPLKELARSSPSEVMSRNSISATNRGSTQVTFGFLVGLVSLDLGLTTVSSCLRIWLETVRDHPVATLPILTRSFPSLCQSTARRRRLDP
jgi:hypothetical protein